MAATVNQMCDCAVSALKSLAARRGVANVAVDLRFKADHPFNEFIMIVSLEAVLAHGEIQIEADLDIVLNGATDSNPVLWSPHLENMVEPREIYSSYDHLFSELQVVEEVNHDNFHEGWESAFVGSRIMDICTVRGYRKSFDMNGMLTGGLDDSGDEDPNDPGIGDEESVAYVKRMLQLLSQRRVTRSMTNSALGGVQ